MKHEFNIIAFPEKQFFEGLKTVYSNKTAFPVQVCNNTFHCNNLWAILANSCFVLHSTHTNNHMISALIVV